MDQNVAKYRIGIRMKKWWCPPFVCGGPRGYCIVTKIKAMSLWLLVFRRDIVDEIFLEHLKECKLSSSYAGIRNIPSDVSYDK